MKKIRLKQGSLAWEKARLSRIGSSEIFDIVRYYATEEELQNCGINAETFLEEKPYTTAWALYHKMLDDGIYKKESLEPEYAEYGHAVEPYGVYYLQKNRVNKLKPGEVYVNDKLIASLDVSGIAEEIDMRPFDCGIGTPIPGQKFVCEQKSMRPEVLKRGIPFKYIIQAQYQIEMTKADFFILQIMILKDDTDFIRGKVCQMGKKARQKYLDDNLDVKLLYFRSNPHLAHLIRVCLDRFFDDVKEKREPTPYIENDCQQNIIESIRINSQFDEENKAEFDFTAYLNAKSKRDEADGEMQAERQKIIELAKEKNACMFRSKKGDIGKFSKNGRFLLKEAEVV